LGSLTATVRDAVRDWLPLLWLSRAYVWWWFENWIVDASKYEQDLSCEYFVLLFSFEKI
jgi:hypothetical protein